MPKISAAIRSERRQQLVDAGWRCAGRMGYRDMTVDDVCAEARVSKGAFYGYFSSKQDLLIALLEEDDAGLDAVLDDLARRDLTNVARLRSFAREMCSRGAGPAAVQVRSDLWAAILTEPVIRDHVVAAVQRRRAVLRGWIDAAVAAGELAPIPANAFASVLLALGDGLTLHSSLDPASFRWTNIARALTAVFGSLGPEPKVLTGVQRVSLRNVRTSETSQLRVGGVFIFVGFTPNTSLVDAHLAHDAAGYYVTDPGTMMTIVPGVFAAGDVRSQLTRQITTAVGDATTAAIAAMRWMEAPAHATDQRGNEPVRRIA